MSRDGRSHGGSGLAVVGNGVLHHRLWHNESGKEGVRREVISSLLLHFPELVPLTAVPSGFLNGTVSSPSQRRWTIPTWGTIPQQLLQLLGWPKPEG